MRAINITCEQCGRQLTVPERYQGRALKCPTCGHPFLAEAPGVEPEPVAVPAPAAPPAPAAAASFETSPFEEPPAPGPAPAPAPASPALPAEVVSAGVAVGETAPVYWRVRRVAPLSLAVLSAALHAALGLVVGIVVAIASFTPVAQEIPVVHGPLVGILAVLVLPVAYAAAGFVAGAVTAVVYNLAARLTGGVSLLLD